MSCLVRYYYLTFNNRLDIVWFSDQFSHSCLTLSKLPWPTAPYLRIWSSFIFSQNNFSWCCNIFDNIQPYPSSLQHRLSLLSTNKSFSLRILPKSLIHPTSLSYHFASNSIEPNGNIVSNSIALNGNIVSHSITPIGKIVPHNIVDEPNLLLLKHISYSFPSASIRHVNGIDYTFHSNLYFDVHQRILLLPPLLLLHVSSFRLECFLLFSQNKSPHVLAYNLLWLYFEYFFILGTYLLISFFLVVSTVSFHVIVPLFMALFFAYFHLLHLHHILH